MPVRITVKGGKCQGDIHKIAHLSWQLVDALRPRRFCFRVKCS